MYKNRFYKNTLGVDAEVLVVKAVAYTDDATMKAFVANAVEGEVAVVKFSDDTIYSGAVAVGDRVFIAMKRDGHVDRTAPFVAQAGILQKIAYVAPVKHVVTVTTTTGIAELAVTGGITYTSRVPGADGNDTTITYVDPAGNNASLSVSVSGTAITVNLATDGASAPTSTATLVAAAVNAHATASTLVDATVTGTGSTVQAAYSVANLAGGSDISGLVQKKGNYYEIVIIETTPNLEPLPRWNYSVTATLGESFNDSMTRLVAKINDATAPENQNKTLIVTAAIASNDNITLTAIDYNVHFSAAVRGDWEDFASVALTTGFKIGTGTYEQAKGAEINGDIRRGVQTQYPNQNATNEEFGAPTTSFADVAAAAVATPQFVTYQITYVNSFKSVRNDQEFRKNYIFLMVHDSTTDPISALDTIFANID